MYKLILCLRYLRSRYIALACVVSVMLGVATMIVTNSVMGGFSHMMHDQLHGMFADLTIESRSLDGVPNAPGYLKHIDEVAGQYIEGISPIALTPAMLSFQRPNGEYFNRQVILIGIDPETFPAVSCIKDYLQHPQNRQHVDFNLKNGGYDVVDYRAVGTSQEKRREPMSMAGWQWRRQQAKYAVRTAEQAPSQTTTVSGNPPGVSDPFLASTPVAHEIFDPNTEQHSGAILGIGIGSYRTESGDTEFNLLPGDDVEISYPSAGRPPKPLSAKFTITDYYDSKNTEYDSTSVFVTLAEFQKLRGMIDPSTQVANFNRIQIKLKPGVDPEFVRDLLQKNLNPSLVAIGTLADNNAAMFAAVSMETSVLNVLLFMIIAVAGFGILSIFTMIVLEKTREIGILKSLGASSRGVMGIFLTFGFVLGILGSGVGVVVGLLFIQYINEIADGLGKLTGQKVFDPSIYYFYRIPTIVEPFTVTWIALGAMAIAVLASILPAWRAARLHPVSALRWE